MQIHRASRRATQRISHPAASRTLSLVRPAKDHHVFPVGELRWAADAIDLVIRQPALLGEMYELIDRHASGYWSRADEPSEHDINMFALQEGRPIVSCFALARTAVYLRTNGARTVTTVQLTAC